MTAAKTVMVTGGADGIGFGIARAFVREGAAVVIADINTERLETARTELADGDHPVTAIHCDIGDAAAIDRLFAEVEARHGRLDVLVNNAGVVVQAPAESITLEQWNLMVSVNLTGLFWACRAAKPLMARGGGGQIINIASVGGHASSPGFAGYGATKGGVLLLTRALAVEWGPANIRVNSVSPGSIGTAMSLASRALDPEAYDRRVARVPLKRIAGVDDVADVVVFLASERSGYVSGTDIKVDGAIMAQHPGYS